MDYHNNEKKFRSLTGLSPEQFRGLLPYFEESHNGYFTHYSMNGRYRNNRRRFVIYGNSPLPTVADRLFFILVYLKNNPLQEYHAACFDMDQKHCNRFIHVLYRILESCLHGAGVMPAESQKQFCEILHTLSGKMNRFRYCFMTGRSVKFPVLRTRKNRKNITAERKRGIQSKMRLLSRPAA